MLELFKLVVQPVAVERDAAGKVVGERVGDSIALYSLEDITEFYSTIEAQFAEINAASEVEDDTDANPKE